MDEKITYRINGREMTKEEFETERKRLQEQSIQLSSIGQNCFVTRLLD